MLPWLRSGARQIDSVEHVLKAATTFACLAMLATTAVARDTNAPWPVATANDDCRALVGTYAARGESPDGYQPYLSAYLFPAAVDAQIAGRAYQADRIEISADGAALRVRALRGVEGLAATTLTCEKGVARVAAAPVASGQSEPVNVDKLDTALLAAADGSLLIKRSEGATGWYDFFVIGDLNETNWYRFARVATP